MLNKGYILGLVDGEGSFTVFIRNPQNKKEIKRRTKAEPRFYLKLIEKDKKILFSLKEFFGCGNIYYQKDNRKNHQNCYRYEVTKRDDLKNVIIPFFRKNQLMLPSKVRDFEIFCRIMKMIDDKCHLNKKGLKRMYLLKQNMH